MATTSLLYAETNQTPLFSHNNNFFLILQKKITGWSGKRPQCLVDWCPDPPEVSGGQVELKGRRAGSTAFYRCDAGHVIIGEPVKNH